MNPNSNRLRWKIIAAINIFIAAIFLCLALIAGIIPTVDKFGLFQLRIEIFVAAAALVMALIYLAQTKRLMLLPRWSKKIIVAALLAGSLGFSLMLAYALASYGYTWDTQIVLDAATNYARTGMISTGFSNYIEMYSNNSALFLVLVAVVKVAMFFHVNSLNAVLFFNVLVLFAAQVLIYMCAKMLYGSRIALLSILFSFVLIAASLFVQTPYTDTMAIVFPILLLYLSLLIYRSKEVWQIIGLSALLGITTIIGTLIKPTVIIALIGIVLTIIIVGLTHLNRSAFRRILPKAGAVISGSGVAMLLTYTGFNVLVDSQNIFPYPYVQASKYTIPIVHFVDIGMKTKEVGYSVSYGGYSPESIAQIEKLPTKSERTAYSVASIRNQLAAYGPYGYASFLANKADWIMSDGTFFAYGEGDNSHITFTHQDDLSRFIRRYTVPGGQGYLLYGNTLQVVWIALLLLIALQFVLGLLRRSTRRNVYLLGLRMMIIGILLFLLLFEGRSRYIFLYLPIFIVLGMYTLTWFNDPKRSSLTDSHDRLRIRQ